MEGSTLHPPPLPDRAALSDSGSDPSISTAEALRKPDRPLRRVGAFVWKYSLGVLACQHPASAVLVVGWSYRLARRAAVKTWWQRSPCRKDGESFRRFAREAEGLAALVAYPNWFRGDSTDPAAGVVRRSLRRAFGGFVENVRLGWKGIANTWVLTLLPGLIMLFSWYAGWNNSFNKGYELAAVGPATGFLGIVLLITVLFYLPVAQARQAVAGEAGVFYHFRENRQLIRLRWHLLALLALAYAAFGAVLMVMGAFLGFLPEARPELLEATPPEQLAFLQRYFLACGLFVFPAYVLLRCWAVKIYAGALLRAYERGLIHMTQLRLFEREMFRRLRLESAAPAPVSTFPTPRQRQWLLSLPGRLMTGFLAAFFWFILAAETYVVQFVNYQHVARWLNHPLIQLPWFHHVPEHLKAAAEAHPSE